jgi:hypothetical protein
MDNELTPEERRELEAAAEGDDVGALVIRAFLDAEVSQ